MKIDGSVYPDCTPPKELTTFEERADYLHRICAAFDHGIVPEEDTIDLLESWKSIFDHFVIVSSPAYHAFRGFYGWEPMEHGTFFADPVYMVLDRLEGREDHCVM